jgi:hypothetical protein
VQVASRFRRHRSRLEHPVVEFRDAWARPEQQDRHVVDERLVARIESGRDAGEVTLLPGPIGITRRDDSGHEGFEILRHLRNRLLEAVGVEEEYVPVLERNAALAETGLGIQAECGPRVPDLIDLPARSDPVQRRVARRRNREFASLGVEHTIGGCEEETGRRQRITQRPVHRSQHRRRCVRAQDVRVSDLQLAPEMHREHRSAQPVAGRIRDQQCDVSSIDPNDVIEVAADVLARAIHRLDMEILQIGSAFGQQ